MKNFLLINFLLLCFAMNAKAQCNPTIPTNAVVVNSTDTINGGFDPIWVCSGDSLHTDGGFHNIYLESGSVMTSGGGIDTIYVKYGASLFLNGGIHYIIYDTISDLYSLGGIPTLDSSCGPLIFDYTNAPVNGCFVNPIANFISNDDTFCAGTCINFSNQSAGAISYSWSFSGGNPATSTDANPATICYNAPGNYDVTLIAINGTGSDTLSYTNLIHVDSIPVISVSSLEICIGQSGILVASGAENYSWAPPSGLNTNTGDTVIANPNTSSSYTVSGVNNAGCSNLAFTVVTVNPLPVVPMLIQNGDTLFSSTGYSGYQWYSGLTLIVGATNYFYIGTLSGNYHLVVTDDKGCEATADIDFVFNSTNDFDIWGGDIEIFPNPSSGFFILKIYSGRTGNFQIAVSDVQGKEVFSEVYKYHKENPEVFFDLSSQSSGVYFIHYSSDTIQLHKKIVLHHF